MGHTTPPRINEEDYHLMKKIAKHNFVDMYYIYDFYKTECKKKTVDERINQLAKYDYLAVIHTFIPKEYTFKDFRHGYKIVALGNRGVELLNGFGIEAKKVVPTLRDASPYRMYHQAQVATVCDKIEQRYKDNESGYEVFAILSEREIFIDGGRNMPDAVIVFHPKEKYITEQTKDVYIAVFIEIERSYASPHRIEHKIVSYTNNFYDRTFVKKIGLPIVAQRLLFVSQTDGQYNTIKDKINAVKQNSIEILCGKYSEVCKESDKAIYENPRRKDDKKYKLLSDMSE